VNPDVLRRAAAHVLVDDVDAPSLSDDATHHLFRVLRVRDGDLVTVTDGAGRWRECRAVGDLIEPSTAVEHVPRRGEPLTVAFAIPKQDRPEWIVQKLTEIGIDRILLLHAERSVVRWGDDRAERHMAKLARVAAEAVQQSRGLWLPELNPPRPAAEVLVGIPVAEPGGRDLRSGDTTIAVGPEGGWTANELERAGDAVSLGPTVLRVETAAIVAASRLTVHAAC